MAKFTPEEKLQIALRYINGHESSYEIAKSIGTEHATVLKWVKQYQYNGPGIFVKQYTNYTEQFKLNVLNFMIENGTSLNETAFIFGISSHSTILNGKGNLKKMDLMPFNQRKRGILL